MTGETADGPGGYSGKNPDAFDDCLRGGYGTPERAAARRGRGPTVFYRLVGVFGVTSRP
ncbi:hypothetical protein [Streptomyces sp. NPDC047976]|uniref:hypothetical protein n=1 Tax=unclassified Streptomyces TaxID=2593676 RepID=UPI00342283EC